MNTNILHFELNTEEKTISQGQYLEDIMSEIPTNTILAKTVPGIGATTLEIKSKRHSIIIEPNVPVIKGKEKKNKQYNLFGVYESVSTNNILAYLEKPLKKDEYKKIMTTPESFFKVMRAMQLLQIDCYKDYMLLFDECDRIIKDNVASRFLITSRMYGNTSICSRAYCSCCSLYCSGNRAFLLYSSCITAHTWAANNAFCWSRLLRHCITPSTLRLGWWLPPRVGFLLSQIMVLTARFRNVALRLGLA